MLPGGFEALPGEFERLLVRKSVPLVREFEPLGKESIPLFGSSVAKLLGRFTLPESLWHDAFRFAREDVACVFNDLENGQAK